MVNWWNRENESREQTTLAQHKEKKMIKREKETKWERKTNKKEPKNKRLPNQH